MAVSDARTLVRVGIRPSWVCLAAVAVPVALAPAVPPVARFLPFALSVVVLGLPHGAVDHLVPARMAGLPLARSVAAVTGVYVLLGGAYLGAWYLAPAASFAFFVLLTWFHWGQGDLYAVLAFAGADHLPTRAERALSAAVRGGLPMLAPLVGFPEAYRRVAAALVSLFDPGGVAALAPAFTPRARLAVGAGLLGATALSVLLGGLRVRGGAARGPWLLDAGEYALLWAYFLVVPPVLAVGLYFSLWHALRHVVRLLTVDPTAAAALDAARVPAAFARFARDAAPLTAATLALFGGFYLLVPVPPEGPMGLLGFYLVGIAVLTLPHVAVVTWMDRRQAVW